MSLLPTRPPLAPVRSRPSLALGTCPVRQLAAPRPARGGRDYPRTPSKRKAEYCGKVWSREVLQTSRSLINIRSIESREHSIAARAYAGAPSLEAPSLRCSSLGASSLVAPMLRPPPLGDSLPSISLLTENSTE